MYDPVDYGLVEFRYSRWEMIRPFKENRHFKKVHKSLNGLIAFLESQAKEGEGSPEGISGPSLKAKGGANQMRRAPFQ